MIARPGLGVITFAPRGGGVAYVGRLLRRVLTDARGAAPWSVELWPDHRGAPTRTDALRLALRLIAPQALGRVDWMMLNHVAIARAQLALPRQLRRPYAVFVHDIEAWSEDLTDERLRALAGARIRVANSAYTAARVVAAHPQLAPVIPCPLGLLDEASVAEQGVDAAVIEAAGPRAVLIAGRINAAERYKGHDHLIDAWPAVAAAAPDARLVVAGWGDDVGRLKERALRAGVGDRVLFCGFVNDATLRELYRRAAVYAMPSAREGFGLAYLEAMRAGVPCVGSTLDAAGEVIAHGETGYVVDRDRPGELAGALSRLLTDERHRAAMGEAGRRRFLERFTYAHFRERLLAILETAFPAKGTNLDLIEPA